MQLVDLPVELLALLPAFLHNIEDFINASSSCKTLRNACGLTSSKTILRLAAASSRVYFRPDPYFLIAATARQVSDWALLNTENTETLRQAFRAGLDSLFELCIAKGRLTMEDIRGLHASRFSTFNPIIDMIDKCAGEQWYSTPNFWDGGVSDAETIGYDPPRSLFQIAIYGELFSTSMLAAISPSSALPRFDLQIRLEFIKYCIPDWMCHGAYQGFTVEDIGPYAPGGHREMDDNQLRLNHILHCRTWREAWEKVRLQVGPDFEVEWKQQIWESAVQLTGLKGLELLRPMRVEERKERLIGIYRSIERLESKDQPGSHKYGVREHVAFDFPSMAHEVWVCCAGCWGPW
ncbi:hypothetical protein P7C71_g4262, partial [Lecanoromycetidae sp. Uapishka_2]